MKGQSQQNKMATHGIGETFANHVSDKVLLTRRGQ